MIKQSWKSAGERVQFGKVKLSRFSIAAQPDASCYELMRACHCFMSLLATNLLHRSIEYEAVHVIEG